VIITLISIDYVTRYNPRIQEQNKVVRNLDQQLGETFSE